MAKRILLSVLALAALAWPAGVTAQGVSLSIPSIGDGDTIHVRQAGKSITVRLACIVSTETAQSPYGQQAGAYLQQRLSVGREVTLAIKATDSYRRTVAEVIDGINIYLALAAAGILHGERVNPGHDLQGRLITAVGGE